MKKGFIITLMFSILFFSGCSCSLKNNVKDDATDDNIIKITDEEVVGEQNIEGIVLKNETFQVQDGITTIVTKVTNTTDSDFMLKNYQMLIADENGQFTILDSEINENISPKDEKYYTTTMEIDLSSSSKVNYSINVVNE